MEYLLCKYCKHFDCAYEKNGVMKIECNRRYFEIELDISSPFVCGRFKPNKKGKLFLKQQADKYKKEK